MTRRLLLLLSAFAAVFPTFAQHRFAFEHLTVKQGLSQGTVNCILQDTQGFLWFGTQDGLNRYDGYEVRVFKNDAGNARSLNDNWIVAIAEDTSKALWIQTLNRPAELNRYDPATETFTRVPRDSVHLAGARRSIVAWDYEEPGGIQWHGTNGGGVTRHDPRSGTTTTYTHNPRDVQSLIDDRVMTVYGDRSGMIWIGTKGGLDGLDVTRGLWTHYKHDPRNPASVSDNWVWPVLEDRTGGLWVGTYGGGLNCLDRATGRFTHYRHDESDPRSLGGDQILSLYQDRSGVIWVGTDGQGVDWFHPEIEAFLRYAHDPANPGSLGANSVFCLFVDRTGTLWTGTGDGVDLLEHSGTDFKHLVHDPAKPRSVGPGPVQCFAEDRAGNMWVGLRSGGLDLYDRSSGTFIHFRNDPRDSASLSDNNVYALCADESGELWVGTHKGGLNRYNPSTGKFTRYLHADSISSSLGAVGVWALCEDRSGTLWVGTFGGGLDRFDPQSGTFTHYGHNPADSTSLGDDIVTYLFEDHTGTLWVGTPSGLNRLDHQSGKFVRFREKDGLPNDAIFGILEDDQGNLWVSTNKGLAKFDPRSGKFRTYDTSDGLQGDEFNLNACAWDGRTGEMYFGGNNGFNAFRPRDVKDNPYIPPLVFSGFTRYNTDDEAGKPIVEKGIAAKTDITLSYKDNVATFEFAALSFYNNFKNQYAYRLEGYSDNWIQLGTERKATFTNLDGGEYLLRVRGSNNDGLWNEEGTALRLIVTPPWWKTRWAYGSYVLLVLGFLYFLRRVEINRREQKARVRESELRTKAVEAEKRALVAENERKTKELEDARQLQLSLLPREVPAFPGYEIAVFMQTATEVGGDYYDFHLGADGTLYAALGDATGHGMQAGIIVTLMKALFVSDATRFPIPEFFGHCSRAIRDIRLQRMFMAFTLVRVNGNSVSLSSAGMPPVYLYRANDGSLEEILLKGMPLGAMKNFPYNLYEAELHHGDFLLLLTDGLPEQKNRAAEMYDYTRVQGALRESAARTPREIIDHLTAAGESWMGDALQDDDITLMVIKRST